MDTFGRKFRTQIGGYNKEDVNKYIKECDLKNADKLEQLNKTISSLQEELSSAIVTKKIAVDNHDSLLKQKNEIENELSQKNTIIDDLTFSLQEKSKELNDLSAIITSLEEKLSSSSIDTKQENDELRESLAERENECNELSEKNANLESQITELTNELASLREGLEAKEKADGDITNKESNAYKLHMYNKISSQLGDILINANRTADEILNSARIEADKLKNDTDNECAKKREECNSEIENLKKECEEEAEYIRNRLAHTASNLLSSVIADLHGSIENCTREINSCITDMQYEIKTLSSKIIGRSNEMNERINYYQNCAYDGIEKKLNAIDEAYNSTSQSDDTK